MAITIVFDIDHTLADCRLNELNDDAHKYLYIHGYYAEAVVPHYFFPGVVSLMKELFNTDGVNIAFFSGGEPERINLLIEKLLTKALGEEKYKEVKDSILVCTRANLSDVHNWEELEATMQYEYPGCPNLSGVKDLNSIIGDDGELKNTMLVDNSWESPKFGQKENTLPVSPCQAVHFAEYGWQAANNTQNELFDFTSRIFEIINIHKEEEKPVTEILREMLYYPFEKNSQQPTPLFFKDIWGNEQEKRMENGLKILQKHNKNLRFFSQESINICKSLTLTEKQSEALKQRKLRCEEKCASNEDCTIS